MIWVSLALVTGAVLCAIGSALRNFYLYALGLVLSSIGVVAGTYLLATVGRV